MQQTVNIGKIISGLLENKNMTQRELANRVGVTEVTIGRYINGTREPKGTILKDIATALNVTTDYLLGHTSDPKLNKKDEQDIAKRIEALAADLANQENLMLHGEIMDDETRELLKASLETAVKMSKIKAKEKFTPNKYKK